MTRTRLAGVETGDWTVWRGTGPVSGRTRSPDSLPAPLYLGLGLLSGSLAALDSWPRLLRLYWLDTRTARTQSWWEWTSSCCSWLWGVRCEVCPPRVPDQYWHRESSAAPHVTLSHREQTFHHVTYHRSPSQCCALEITPHISHQSNTVDATSTKFLVASWIFCFAEFKQKSVMTIKQQM